MHTASRTRQFTHQDTDPVPAGSGALFRPHSLGPLILPNRIVMAPLTRSRTDRRGVPSPLAPEYYAQRASAGLIISEAATVSRQGTGYDNGPGLYTDEQVAGWRAITDAVHEAGGRIFVQLFHVGRMSHPAFQEGGPPVGASAVAAGHAAELYDHVHPFTRPRALHITELAGITGQFRAAAEKALQARFDGVEVHAANGTLSEPAHLESPYLGSRFFRPLFSRTIIAAGGHTARSGTARIQRGDADLIAYGKLFISNPDLPARFASGAPLTEPDRATFYDGGAAGYTDYPSLAQAAADVAVRAAA